LCGYINRDVEGGNNGINNGAITPEGTIAIPPENSLPPSSCNRGSVSLLSGFFSSTK